MGQVVKISETPAKSPKRPTPEKKATFQVNAAQIYSSQVSHDQEDKTLLRHYEYPGYLQRRN
jgi:hypothetical protein